MEQQTVAAIATPPGRGGIAVIRLSGPQSYAVAAKVFAPQSSNKKIEETKGYTALFGRFLNGQRVIDEGIALCFRAPHSYTGEDVIELSCHGGEEVSAELLAACLQAGAFPAGPGEFTKRAVLNGRLSLTQAEAVMDLISATSRQGVAAAEAALGGALYRAIDEQRKNLTNLAGHLAAWVDYPEEDVPALTEEEFLSGVQTAQAALQKLIDGYDAGSILLRGVRAAIVGSPNVGKSTLFNLLSGFERAIVTPVAGTTRDVVRESIRLGGITLHLADTAGLRTTQDVVETEGIKRSYDEMNLASFVVAVFDGSQPLGEEEMELARRCEGRPALGIINKSDLGTVVQPAQLQPYFTRVVLVSAKDATAKEQVEEAALAILKVENVDIDAPMLANERQLSAAVAARDALAAAQKTMQEGFTFDAAGVYLEDALNALSALSGESASEAVIEDVFSRFCVGK